MENKSNKYISLISKTVLVNYYEEKERNESYLRNQPSGWKQRKLSSPCRDEAKVKYLYFLAKQLYAGFD